MKDPIEVTLDLRGKKYTGIITDQDGLLFMGAVFNPEEASLMDLGRLQEAETAYRERANKRLEELRAEGKSDEDLLEEWAQYLLVRLKEPEMRSLVASRIKERFCTIPDTLVRWHGSKGGQFAINLNIVELIQVLIKLMSASIELLQKNAAPPENNLKTSRQEVAEQLEASQPLPAPQRKAAEEPKEILPPPEPEPVAIVPEVVEPEKSELDERISELKVMLAQSEQQKAALEQERQRQQKAADLESAIIQQRG